MMCPPEVVAINIHAWVSTQLRAGRSIPVSDYFYHAVKKIHMMGEYHLVRRDALKEFFEKLKPLILEYCPPGDRAVFQKNMDAMASAVPTSAASQIEVIYRQTGTQAQQSSGISEPQPSDEFSGMRLLMERIRREITRGANSGETQTEQVRQETISEALAQAARSSRESMQLKQVLQHLQAIGIKAGTEEVFRALGRDVPEWSLQLNPEVQLPENSNLTAMRRIITQSEDRKESAIRFHQMVKAAGERFNEGHLGQAVAIFDLAEKMITAKEVDENIIENLRRRGHEDLDADKLRKYAETPHQHGHLRSVLNFFESLRVQGLIKSLSDESKRDRRRMLLA
ncbi:MAG: hypothetical protein ACRD4B_04815, partial [Acidobacteriota bacterium]